MKKLIHFEMIRLYRRKLVLILPAVIILIGFFGLWLSSVFAGNTTTSSESKILGVYNAYSQFSFIFLSFIYISIFTQDSDKGIDYFLNEFGYSLPIQYFTKFLNMFVISFVTADLFLIILAVILKIKNWYFLFLAISSITVIFLWIISFSLLLSLIVKKAMLATILNFILYIIFDVCNIVLYGLTNPADPNSIVFTTLSSVIGGDITHRTLAKVTWDLNAHAFMYSSMIPFVYTIAVIFVGSFYLKIISRKKGLEGS